MLFYINARYCYEYKGGHIRGAENFGSWDEESFFNAFLPKNLGPKESVPGDEEKAQILIFHCEFSSARGPALMKQLRSRYVFKQILLNPVESLGILENPWESMGILGNPWESLGIL